MDGVDLDRLEWIARAADSYAFDHRWVRMDGAKPYPQRIVVEGLAALVAECFEDPDHRASFADHICAFDPPTCLALIARIRALEASSRPE